MTLDGKTSPGKAKEFKVKKYPAFVFFNRGHPKIYNGPSDTFEDLHNWVYKQVHPPVKEISSEKELWTYLDQQDAVLLYFGPTDINEYTSIYTLVARRYDRAFFLRASNGSALHQTYWIKTTP